MALARDGLIELGYAPGEAEELLSGAEGDSAEELLAQALRTARAMSGQMTVSRDRPHPDAVPGRGGRARPLAAPRRLEDFVGQKTLLEQLGVAIEAASARGEALDHLLLAGPPGLGKTSLAQIVAAELEVPFVQTAGPALERKGDIAAFLTALEPRSVFFVDEIHRLSRTLEETFYPAMEDHRLPITVGQGAGARVVTLELPPFTLVGATTRTGLLTTPLRDRFGIQARLEPYAIDELASIVRRSAGILEIGLEDDGAVAIAARSRGTPRVANRLLKRVRDYAEVRMEGVVTAAAAEAALELLEVDERGLDRLDREILRAICVEVRRRPGRAFDARGGRGRGAGHDRGRLRAVSVDAGTDQAHAAWTRGDAGGVRAFGIASAVRPSTCRNGPGADWTRRRAPLPYSVAPWPIRSSAQTAVIAPPSSTATSASPASRRAARSAGSRSCSNCSTTTTRRRTRRSSSATARVG